MMTPELAIWMLLILPGFIITGYNVYDSILSCRAAKKSKKAALLRLARADLARQSLLLLSLFCGMLVGVLALVDPQDNEIEVILLIVMPACITGASVLSRIIQTV